MESYGPVDYDKIDLLPPAEPTRVVALAHNYRDLVDEKESEGSEKPLLFLKTPSSVIATGDSIEIPETGPTWAEVEVAFIVDKKAKNISTREATEYIRGYTVANDVTTEGIHGRNWHLPRSKARDTFCPLGPHLIKGIDTSDLSMSTHINGTKTQDSTTANRLYDEPAALSHISSLMTLEPGDVVLTGTPAGATDSTVSPGDEVVVNVEKLGTLENQVCLKRE
jgi:2-keto-4-pentenoate hydratase/2-oxohepta-3-ene-1,7-dioic acid hydratase in catechol pathway